MPNIQKLITQNDFHHFYQPICHLPGKHALGYEALIRSQSKLSPDDLFLHAGIQKRLFAVDSYSIYHSISDFFSSVDSHKGNDLLFINIFPSTLIEPSFSSLIQRIVEQFNRFCNRVVFEINESLADLSAWNNPHFMDSLYLLRNHGFLIALDDVGEGAVTFKKIIDVSPHFIKIDKFFSKGLSTCRQRQKIIRLFVEYCKDNCHLILEGIEYCEDLEMAESLGITLGQGYLLGKPNWLPNYPFYI